MSKIDSEQEWREGGPNDAMPIDLGVQMGGGVSNLDLDNLTLTGLSLDMAVGSTTMALAGEWDRDLSAVVRGGAGEVTVFVAS